ncbi:MAG: shikimate kinase [Methanothrix sp.]|uniref:Shikimate kinase n=1 Tax=Methanothrix harundinacea TaxID=301375 RepID=A0A101IL48_9EURY|nr:MAG: shikimate kinase [Methanosaeta sp. SDB]KUK45425.1 MAG: Shikimate kinase [Methanothrix harundinacea]MDD2638165.1 shikimate kinase [Methanothrix sp.]MDI9398232.1 shikimate kinase [Euryarchaeota archaeon]KUK97174.1 MAG: Shikimate kinase [Methanothrix harundinacea]
MKRRGTATALGAATILNAVANWKGSAFGVDLKTSAEVVLDDSPQVKGDVPGIDDRLIVRSVERVLQRFGVDAGGIVRTESEIPLARGLKSSSSAANAAVLATLDALDEELDPLEATRIGVAAAKDAGVTITGAFDDATASMLGGVVVTDNREMELLKREELKSWVLLLVPEEKIFSKDTDVRRSRLIAPIADLIFDLALAGDYARAMTINGLVYCSALRLSSEPIFAALNSGARGASLSGTGPAYAALADDENIDEVEAAWLKLGGRVIRTKVENRGSSKASRWR